VSVLIRITGNRKYAPIWSKLKEIGYCKVECLATEDVLTTIKGVTKEKVHDKKKPKGKVLKTETTDGETPDGKRCTVITFKLVTDTSINNL
jgi:hypothetical protein